MFKNGEYINPFVCFISSGGGSGSNQQSSQGTSGFAALSPQIQQVFNTLAQQGGNYLQGGSQAGQTTNMYTPIPQTAGETSAINTINQGFNPTPQQLSSNINEQLNPYNQDVISQINQQAYGANSALQSGLAGAGQFGSNRATLGANNIANQQAQTIGSVLQPQYQNALTNSLTTIPQLQAQSAAGQLQGGQFQRQLGLQTAQAPITALQSIAQILGILPTQSGQQTSQGSGSSSSVNFGLFSSDELLKENVIPCGVENNFPVFEFSYLGDDARYIGVMAQDVEKIRPDAVEELNGFKAVDYGKIGVKFRRAA